jgi:D-alanyl-lipoteichoic acid acyltransferase DltB (MBOAT superfamily)
MFLHPFLRRLYERCTLPKPPVPNGSAKSNAHGQAVADTRLRNRLAFDFVSAMIYVTALNGTSVLKILLILLVNFKIATALPRHVIPVTTWVFNIGILFANELAKGYPYSVMSEAIVPFFPAAGDWGKFLDSYDGLQPRWEVLFNFTVLRMISFNFDYYWSQDRSRAGSPIEVCSSTTIPRYLCNSPESGPATDTVKKKQLDPSDLSERDRVNMPAPASAYVSFRTYVAYVLYPPLYLAGPILTFNDYISQSSYQSTSVSTKRTILYGIRFLVTLCCMEFLIHTAYMVAISKASPDWSVYTPFQLSMLAYFNLHHIWLKLMIPWRFFRLWALIDGIDPPENMVRCMSDNYSALAFWRSWHRSFNRWTIRYVYVPLGGGLGGGSGRLRGIGNMLAVFTFVALWHDIQLRLLIWGWMVVFFVLPEVLLTVAFPASKWKTRPNTYRVICGIGAVANILMMMTANLVGFAVGMEGLTSIVHGIASSWHGAFFMLSACVVLFVGVQVMFEHREDEKRRGIRLKC